MTTDIIGEPDDDPTKLIYVVRHGATALNASNRMRGWDDPNLNDEGIKDAETVAKAMANIKLGAVFCSDLTRAVSTMKIIMEANKSDVHVNITEDLRTIDVGAWTGQPLEKVEPKLAALQAAWETDPGKPCPHGESWADFQGRQIAAWRQVLRAPGPILVVAHLRCSVWALGYAMLDRQAIAGRNLRLLGRITQSPGRISTLTYSKAAGLKILAANAQEPEVAQP